MSQLLHFDSEDVRTLWAIAPRRSNCHTKCDASLRCANSIQSSRSNHREANRAIRRAFAWSGACQTLRRWQNRNPARSDSLGRPSSGAANELKSGVLPIDGITTLILLRIKSNRGRTIEQLNGTPELPLMPTFQMQRQEQPQIPSLRYGMTPLWGAGILGSRAKSSRRATRRLLWRYEKQPRILRLRYASLRKTVPFLTRVRGGLALTGASRCAGFCATHASGLRGYARSRRWS
jgi:hypothetical protein